MSDTMETVDTFFDIFVREVSEFPMEQTKVPLEYLSVLPSTNESYCVRKTLSVAEAEFLMNWELFIAVRMENEATEEVSNVYLIYGEDTYLQLLQIRKTCTLETSKVRAIVFTVPREIYLAVRNFPRESSARQYLFDKLLLRVVRECHNRTYKWRTIEVLKNLRKIMDAHIDECWNICEQEFWPRLVSWKRVLMMSCAHKSVFNEIIKYAEIQKGLILQSVTDPTKDWQSILEISLHMILSKVLEYGPEAVSVFIRNTNNCRPVTPPTLVTKMSKQFPDKRHQEVNKKRQTSSEHDTQAVADDGDHVPQKKNRRRDIQETVIKIEEVDLDISSCETVQEEGVVDASISIYRPETANVPGSSELNYSQLLEESINAVVEERNMVTTEISNPSEEKLLRLERLAKAVESLEKHGHTVPKRIVADIMKTL